MRLISCYIESFGKIKKQSFSFSEGLNKIVWENGSGKTTLSVFIKVMLYGMSDTKRSSLEENDRKHYLPWDGSVASGSLEFSVGSKRYRAERSFSAKAADDSFALYDLGTGKRSADYSEELGKELFGIDCDGFERTVFLSERNLSEAGKNQTVSAKLGGLVGCDGDIEGLDGAIKALEEERKRYNKRGGGGEIAEIKAQISETEQKLAELDAIEARLASEKDRLYENRHNAEQAQAELKKLQSIKESLIMSKAESASRAHIAEIKESLRQKNEMLAQSKERFSCGVPSYEQINEASYKATEAKKLLDGIEEDPDHERLRKRYGSVTENKINDARSALHIISKSKSPVGNLSKSILLLSSAAIFISLGITLGIAINAYFYLLLLIGFALISVPLIVLQRKKSKDNACLEAIRTLVNALPDRLCENELDEASRAVKEYDEYASLAAFLRYKSAENERNRERAVILNAEAEEFLKKYRAEGDNPFDELRKAVHAYERLTAERESLFAELRILEGKTDLSTSGKPEISEEALEARRNQVEESVSALRRESAALERNIQSLCLRSEERDDLVSRREELAERLCASEKKYKIIQLTKELLTEAKDAMTSRYLGKTKESFERYRRLINEGEDGVFELDTSFSVSKLEGGRAKSSESYSKGTRDLYGIAIRLALVDSLYESETPPIILDDPFIALDDKKARAALKLLCALAERRQIIYFTCSQSRS